MLQRILAEHLHDCLGGDVSVVAAYHIASHGGVYGVWRDKQPLYTGLLPDDVLTIVMNEIVTSLIEPCSDSLLFHAASAAHGERGILMCGASGSGKSTLAARLIQDGFNYISDEVTAIPLDSVDRAPCMTGLARSLVIKAESAFVWRTVMNESDRQVHRFADGSAWVRPDSLRPGCLCMEAVPRLAIFPRYQANVPFEVQRLSKAQTAFALMQHLVNARNLPGSGLHAVMQLAAALDGYAVTYSDAGMVVQWLQ
jgi:hypothetical protein